MERSASLAYTDFATAKAMGYTNRYLDGVVLSKALLLALLGFFPGLALALVDGQTLADRIATGPIPVEEALAIAEQIITALEYAWCVE